MLLRHETMSATGVPVSHHKVTRVELSPDLLDVMVWLESWPTEQQRLDGLAPVARWHVRTPSTTLNPGTNLLAAIGEAVLATPEFSGAEIVADNALAIDTLRARKWAEIKSERTRRERLPFEWGGHLFDADAVKIAGAALDALIAVFANDSSWRQVWVLADNTTAELTAPEMIDVGQALKDRVSALWATSQALREQIDAATTAEEVAAIGWPS